MNRCVLAILAVTLGGVARADDSGGNAEDTAAETGLVQRAKEVGVNRCAARIGDVIGFFHGEDSYGHLAVWHKADPDNHLFHGLTTQTYDDGRQISTLAVAPQGEACDVAFTQVFVFGTSCATARETTFKDWKFYADMQGVALFEDPTADSVTLALVPAGQSCLAIKTGAFY